MTQAAAEQPFGMWIWVPIIRDPNAVAELEAINNKLGMLMALVKVEQDDLNALDVSLDEVATSLSDKIAALQLPTADLQPLLDDVEALRALGAPAPVDPPPVA